MTGGGGDIWGTSDSFHYVWQPLAADGSSAPRSTSQANSDPWAKAGVMIRASSDPGAPYYAVFVTPGNGVVVQSRDAAGDNSSRGVRQHRDGAGVPPDHPDGNHL